MRSAARWHNHVGAYLRPKGRGLIEDYSQHDAPLLRCVCGRRVWPWGFREGDIDAVWKTVRGFANGLSSPEDSAVIKVR